MISQEVFDVIKNEIKLMSDKQLAEMNFLVWNEAYTRSGQHVKDQIESEIESLISETNKPR